MTYQATQKQLIFNDYLKDPNTAKEVFDWEQVKDHIANSGYKPINIDDIDIIRTGKAASHNNNIMGLLLVKEHNKQGDTKVYSFIETVNGFIFKHIFICL